MKKIKYLFTTVLFSMVLALSAFADGETHHGRLPDYYCPPGETCPVCDPVVYTCPSARSAESQSGEPAEQPSDSDIDSAVWKYLFWKYLLG